MDEQSETDLDLTGRWLRRFSFPRRYPPISFVAVIEDRDGWLSGRIEEPAPRGPRKGTNIGATIQGRREHAGVAFLKIYDESGGGYDSVHYEGEITAGGDEIGGRWSIPGNWSGSFIMIRAPREAAAVTRFVVADA